MKEYKIEPKDKIKIAKVIADWRQHKKDFEDTRYWSERFRPFLEIFQKTVPEKPIYIYRNERTDIDNKYEERYTSWSTDYKSVQGFGWGQRRMVWAYVKPEHILVCLQPFGPNIDRDNLNEVILKPGKYDIQTFNPLDYLHAHTLYITGKGPKPLRPRLSESSIKGIEKTKMKNMIDDSSKKIFNFTAKILEEISKKQVYSRFDSKAFIDKANAVLKHSNKSKKDAKYFILSAIPLDIEERYKNEAINWLISLFLNTKTEEDGLELLRTITKNAGAYLQEPDTHKHLRELETFYQLKQLGLQRFLSKHNIYEIHSIEEFFEISNDAEKLWDKYKEEKIYKQDWKKGSNLIYEDDKWQVYIPENKAAAYHLGKGTSWCTAAPGLNYYEDYHQPDDPLIMFINKEKPEEKYQCNLISGHFMDKNDYTAPRETQIKLKILLKNSKYIQERPNLFDKVKNLEFKELPGVIYERGDFGYTFYSRDDGYNLTKFVENIADIEKKDIQEYANYIEIKQFKEKGDRLPSELQIKTKIGIYYLNWRTELLNREGDLPAVERFDGSKEWYKQGKLHRINGPAVVNSDGTEQYYFMGTPCSKEEHEYLVKTTKNMESFKPLFPKKENSQSSISESIFKKTAKILEESKLSDLISFHENAGNKEIVEMIKKLASLNVPLAGILWASKYLASKPPEPAEEIVDVIRKFYIQSTQQKIRDKIGGKSLDINQHKNLSDIQSIILKATETKDELISKQEPISGKDYDLIFENDKYKVVFPKTKEASIYLGDGTVWCTAYKPSSGLANMFYYYSTRDIFLTYFLSKEDKNKTFCIGAVDGQSVGWGEDGGTTVWANNKGFYEDDYERFIEANFFDDSDPLSLALDHYENAYNNINPLKTLFENPTDEFAQDIIKGDLQLLKEASDINDIHSGHFSIKNFRNLNFFKYAVYILEKYDGDTYLEKLIIDGHVFHIFNYEEGNLAILILLSFVYINRITTRYSPLDYRNKVLYIRDWHDEEGRDPVICSFDFKTNKYDGEIGSLNVDSISLFRKLSLQKSGSRKIEATPDGLGLMLVERVRYFSGPSYYDNLKDMGILEQSVSEFDIEYWIKHQLPLSKHKEIKINVFARSDSSLLSEIIFKKIDNDIIKKYSLIWRKHKQQNIPPDREIVFYDDKQPLIFSTDPLYDKEGKEFYLSLLVGKEEHFVIKTSNALEGVQSLVFHFFADWDNFFTQKKTIVQESYKIIHNNNLNKFNNKSMQLFQETYSLIYGDKDVIK